MRGKMRGKMRFGKMRFGTNGAGFANRTFSSGILLFTHNGHFDGFRNSHRKSYNDAGKRPRKNASLYYVVTTSLFFIISSVLHEKSMRQTAPARSLTMAFDVTSPDESHTKKKPPTR